MGLNMPGALLVDLDGTLVDTADANYAAYSAALREVGVSVERDAFERASHGKNWKSFLPTLLDGVDAAPAAVAWRKAELYPSFFHLTRLNQAVKRLLVMSRGVWRTALVTTASRRNAEAILQFHGLRDLFDEIVTGDDALRHKPDPEAYRLAAKRLGVAPDLCIAVEDSDVGVASASAFGAAVLRVQSL